MTNVEGWAGLRSEGPWLLCRESIWCFCWPFSAVARHLSIGNIKSVLLWGCQDKTKPNTRQLACCVSRLQLKPSESPTERARVPLSQNRHTPCRQKQASWLYFTASYTEVTWHSFRLVCPFFILFLFYLPLASLFTPFLCIAWDYKCVQGLCHSLLLSTVF